MTAFRKPRRVTLPLFLHVTALLVGSVLMGSAGIVLTGLVAWNTVVPRQCVPIFSLSTVFAVAALGALIVALLGGIS
jgi:hypothetical protein